MLRTRMTCTFAARAQILAAPAAFRRDLDKPDTSALLCTLDMALMSLSWVRRAFMAVMCGGRAVPASAMLCLGLCCAAGA